MRWLPVQLPSELDAEALASAVTRCLGSPVRDIEVRQVRAIHNAFNQTTAALYRLCGTANGEHWSLVAKVVHASDDPFGSSDDPADPNYWLREASLYAAGVLDNLPGVRAPRCFGVDHREATATVWLEDLGRDDRPTWTAPRCERAARSLGAFNGAYLARRPLPQTTLVTSGWHRSNVATRLEPPADGGRLRHLWDRSRSLLDVLDRLPQTFCHLDAFSRNLFVDDAADTVVAVDWSYAGIAPVGVELAPLVVATVCFGDAEPDALSALEVAALDGYLAGLRVAGWDPDPELVALGYHAAAGVRYGLFPMGTFLADASLRVRFERVFDRPADEIAQRWDVIVEFLLDRADAALHADAVLQAVAR
jgi:Phosphotransferase enzyme family